MSEQPSRTDAIDRVRAWCARQERCHSELRSKLFTWQVPPGDVEDIVSRMIGEGFLNELRFAEHYAVSKSRQKGWGPRKIEQALRARQISEPCIKAALNAIDASERERDLQRTVQRRLERLRHLSPLEKRAKLFRHFVGKGFAANAVEKALAAVLEQAS